MCTIDSRFRTSNKILQELLKQSELGLQLYNNKELTTQTQQPSLKDYSPQQQQSDVKKNEQYSGQVNDLQKELQDLIQSVNSRNSILDAKVNELNNQFNKQVDDLTKKLNQLDQSLGFENMVLLKIQQVPQKNDQKKEIQNLSQRQQMLMKRFSQINAKLNPKKNVEEYSFMQDDKDEVQDQDFDKEFQLANIQNKVIPKEAFSFRETEKENIEQLKQDFLKQNQSNDLSQLQNKVSSIPNQMQSIMDSQNNSLKELINHMMNINSNNVSQTKNQDLQENLSKQMNQQTQNDELGSLLLALTQNNSNAQINDKDLLDYLLKK